MFNFRRWANLCNFPNNCYEACEGSGIDFDGCSIGWCIWQKSIEKKKPTTKNQYHFYQNYNNLPTEYLKTYTVTVDKYTKANAIHCVPFIMKMHRSAKHSTDIWLLGVCNFPDSDFFMAMHTRSPLLRVYSTTCAHS